jgi:hypothetical protein
LIKIADCRADREARIVLIETRGRYMIDTELKKILPPPAKEKLRLLERLARQANAAARAIFNEVEQARKARGDALVRAKVHLDVIIENLDKFPGYQEADGELKRVTAEWEQANQHWLEVSAPLSYIRQWLETMMRAGAKIVSVEPPATKLSSNPECDIQNIRQQIERLDVEYRAVESTLAPPADLKKRLIASVDQLAAEAGPGLFPATRIGPPVNISERLQLPGIGVVRDHVADTKLHAGTVNFLVWLLRDILIERFSQLIDEQTRGGDVMTDAERDKKLRAISAKKLEVERVEERLIELSGNAVPRRAEADPRAILGVVDQ